MATSPLPSRGPKRGRKCYVTPAFSGVPNAKCGEQNQKGSPTKGNKIRSGCLTPAFSTAQKRAEVLPLLSRGSPTPSAGSKIRKGPQQRGTKSEVAASPLPSRGPKRGRKCYPCILGGPQRQVRGAKSEVVPNKGEQNQKWLPHPCILGGPQNNGTKSEGPGRGDKIKSGYINAAFLGFPIAGRHEQETKQCLFSMQEWCLSIEPFSHPPPPDLGGSIDPPPPSTCNPDMPSCMEHGGAELKNTALSHTLDSNQGLPLGHIRTIRARIYTTSAKPQIAAHLGQKQTAEWTCDSHIRHTSRYSTHKEANCICHLVHPDVSLGPNTSYK